MTDAVAQRLGIDAFVQGQGRVGVANVVKANTGDSREVDEATEACRDGVPV
ncbi:MAG: hypothetical protein ABI934_12385 [Actinomycetota bacterium]